MSYLKNNKTPLMKVLPIFTNISNRAKKHRDVIYNQAYNTLHFILVVAISLLTVKLITSKIEPELFGMYRNVLAVLSLCMITTISGINKTLGGYVAKNYHGTVRQTIILSFKTGTIGVLVLTLFGLYSFTHKQGLTESIFFFVAALVFLPYSIFPRYSSILAGLQRFKDILILGLISKVTLFLIAVIVILLFKQGILAYGLSQLVVATLFFIVFFIYSTKKLHNTKIDRGYFKHSFMISLFGIGSQIITPGIQMYLNYVLGGAALAFFVISERISDQVGKVVKPIMYPIAMKLAKKGNMGHNIAVIKLIPLSLLFGVFLYAVLFLGIDIFGPFIISDSYEICLYYAKLFGLTVLLSPLFALLNANAVFEKKNKAYSISLYSEQFIKIIFYVIFVSTYGIASIAITNFIAITIRVMMLIYFIRGDIRLINIRNERALDTEI